MLDPLEAVPLQDLCVLSIQESPGNSAGPEIDVPLPFLDTGTWIVTSAICMRPPGTSTRKIDAKTTSLSGIRSITPLEITTSKLPLANGNSSTSPSMKRTLSAPIAAAETRAFSSISEVMSIPVTLPSGPTIWAATSESVPAPEPRSSTRSPGTSRPSENGFATPANDSAALSRDDRELRRVVEVFGPAPAGREDEIPLRLLRDRCIGLLGLALRAVSTSIPTTEGHGFPFRGRGTMQETSMVSSSDSRDSYGHTAAPSVSTACSSPSQPISDRDRPRCSRRCRLVGSSIRRPHRGGPRRVARTWNVLLEIVAQWRSQRNGSWFAVRLPSSSSRPPLDNRRDHMRLGSR